MKNIGVAGVYLMFTLYDTTGSVGCINLGVNVQIIVTNIIVLLVPQGATGYRCYRIGILLFIIVGKLLFFMTGERESTMSSMCTQSVSLKQYLVKNIIIIINIIII